MSVSPEDRALAVGLRRHVARSNLDISRLIITCSKGIVELNGTIATPRNNPGNLDLRKEFKVLQQQILAFRGVRDLYYQNVRIAD